MGRSVVTPRLIGGGVGLIKGTGGSGADGETVEVYGDGFHEKVLCGVLVGDHSTIRETVTFVSVLGTLSGPLSRSLQGRPRWDP